MTRVATALVLAILLAASLAEAQRGWRGGRGGWGGEMGAPPRFPTDTDFDGTFHFCRLMYQSVRSQQRGLGWGTDYPYADINFSIRLSELTKTKVGFHGTEPNHLVVRPTDPALFQCPFVIASDPGSAGFSEADVNGLRDYLLKGGFFWVDDFWGPWAWDAFANEIGKVLPQGEYPIRELGPDHPIFRTLFPVTQIPQVPSIQFWGQSGGETSEMGEESAHAHMAAISDKHGRVMVLLTHNTDISDSWEREGEDPQFFLNFSPNGYAVGLNSVVYAMSH
ncbi:MAG: hypothetical protein A3J29_13370 [Acidobacteria bacterium RIFCSPLOWO2_12_FULL_67_14b]|nr:MAG: hypothetical protein A3J29_13370 [Acidobacteria bacterium RIFCSPLOWO2_12_FULL_67_14b]